MENKVLNGRSTTFTDVNVLESCTFQTSRVANYARGGQKGIVEEEPAHNLELCSLVGKTVLYAALAILFQALINYHHVIKHLLKYFIFIGMLIQYSILQEKIQFVAMHGRSIYSKIQYFLSAFSRPTDVRIILYSERDAANLV